jgi:hypothetical protein
MAAKSNAESSALLCAVQTNTEGQSVIAAAFNLLRGNCGLPLA